MASDIVLALGSGGARGAAHIGVIRFLESRGFRIRAVAGTSIGAIVAALYAAGFTTAELETLVGSVEPAQLYGRLLSDGAGLLSLRGVSAWLTPHLGGRSFADLALPCAVVAVDVHSQQPIFIQHGQVIPAVLGSVAVPGVFPPMDYPPYLLIDGGTLDPIPVRAARMLAPDLPVVAVALHAPLGQPTAPFASPIHLPSPVGERIRRLKIAQAFGVFLDAVTIGQRELSELRLAVDLPEVVIRPSVGDITMLEKVNVPAIAMRGEQAALQAYPALRGAVSLAGRLRRRLGLRSSA